MDQWLLRLNGASELNLPLAGLTSIWPFSRDFCKRPNLIWSSKRNLKCDWRRFNNESHLFDSRTPFSRVIAFMSPSRNLRNGCTKLMYDEPMNSRSHWPSFCSAWPTLVSALPYGPSWPKAAPACTFQIQLYNLTINICINKSKNDYFNHVQPHVLQIAQPRRFLLLDDLENVILCPIARVGRQHGLGVAQNLLRPHFGVFGAFGQVFVVSVQFGLLGGAQLLLG